jgi:hypothetical protein
MAVGAEPEAQDHVIARSREIVVVLDQVIVNATTERISRALGVGAFRHFTLYLRIGSTGSGSHIVQVIPQFLEPRSGIWHDFRQGIFASLVFEDTVHATERQYVYRGDNLGREMRVRLEGTNTTGSLYFTVSAAVELYN